MNGPNAAAPEQARAALTQMQAVLQESGRTTRMFEPTPDVPTATLAVTLSSDEKERARELNVNIMPLGPDDAQGTAFVQFYLQLPFLAPEERLFDVRAAATILNNRLGIGHFGVNQQGEIFLRYVLATPVGRPLDEAMLEEIVDFLDYTQEHFSDYLEGVCEEEISVLVMEQVIEAAEAEPPL